MGQVAQPREDLALRERHERLRTDEAVKAAIARRKLVSSGSVALLLEAARTHQRAVVRLAKQRGWS